MYRISFIPAHISYFKTCWITSVFFYSLYLHSVFNLNNQLYLCHSQLSVEISHVCKVWYLRQHELASKICGFRVQLHKQEAIGGSRAGPYIRYCVVPIPQ